MLGLGRLVLDTVVVVGAFVIATVIAMGYDDRIKAVSYTHLTLPTIYSV